MTSPKLLTRLESDDLTIEEIWDLYRRYVNPGQVDLISAFGFGHDTVERAEGAWIYTRSGRRILDFTGGVGVLNHGHNHPRILEARRAYEDEKRMEVHKNFFSPYVAALSHNLAQILPGDLEISYFPNSGAEAVEGAVKMAYKYHGGARRHILSADISFHGKLLGSGSLTGSPEVHFAFPRIPNTSRFEYGSIESVEECLRSLRREDGSSDVYALIVEPFSASSLRACSEEFLVRVRELCDENDVVLIFDEVYTGWGKCGRLFHFMHYDVLPDILTSSKSFGGGKASIALYVTRPHVFAKAYGNLNDATLHSTTYNAFGEETVTALEALRIVIDDDYAGRAQQIYERLHPGLVEIQRRHDGIVQDVRGAGALNGILLRGDRLPLARLARRLPSAFLQDERFAEKLVTAAVIDDLYRTHGILTFYGSNREIPLILSPPLVIADAEIDYLLESLDKTLSKGLVKLCTPFVRRKLFG